MRRLVHIVDDDSAVRDSLAVLLTLKGYSTRLYPSGDDFLGAVAADEEGCVLLDLKMPGRSGLDVLEALADRKIGLPVVFLTGHGDVSSAVAALKAGAADFIEKPPEEDALLEAIEAACARGRDPHRAAESAAFAKLTERERAILEKVAIGLTSREIAELLAISPRTVEVHRAKLLTKLGARNTTEMMRVALPFLQPSDAAARK